MVLASDVDTTSFDRASRRKSKNGLVVPAVAKRHAIRVQTSCHADNLVAHANTEDRLIPLGERSAQLESGFHAVTWVTWTVGQEKTIEFIPDCVEVVIPGKDSDSCAPADKGAEDVGLGAKVQDGDFNFPVRVQLVRSLRGNLIDEVFQRGVPIFVCLRGGEGCVGAHRNTAEGGTLVTEQAGDSTGIDTSNARDVVPQAPRGNGFHGGVVRILFCDVPHDDTGALDVLGLEDDADVLRVEGGRVMRNAVVADHRRGEDQNLAAIGWIGHGLRICTTGQKISADAE